jgi:macrolide transport system ATP-binding/permease protein
MLTLIFWEQFKQDIRYSLRRMVNDRAFTILSVLLVALGVGANTAIFSFMDAILFRSLPVPDPASLVILKWHSKSLTASVVHDSHGSIIDEPKLGLTGDIFPFPAFQLFQKDNSVFSSVFAYCPVRGTLNWSANGQADVATGEYVSGEYFRGLEVMPSAGRLIISDDDQEGAAPVVVVSTAFSVSHFGSDAKAVGQPIVVNSTPFTIVGVVPPEFFGVDPAEAPAFYLPMHTSVLVGATDPFGVNSQWYLDGNKYWVQVMARTRPGISHAQAQAAMALPFQQWVASTAADDRERANLPALLVQDGGGGLDALRRRYAKPLYVLMTLVGLILAIACANVANLLLARATARAHEMALRMSLGAARSRVVRQLLTESVVMAVVGGVVGVLFAFWGISFLGVMLVSGQPNLSLHAELNWHVLGMAAILSILTGVVFGLAPALQLTRTDVIVALKEARSGRTRRHFGISPSQVFIVSQIALSLLILVAAGLFVRTLSNLESVNLGFNRENVLLFRLNALGRKDPEIGSFYGGLQKQFRSLPGVRDVGLSNAPLVGTGTWRVRITVSGKPVSGTRFLAVGPEFFTTMQIPMVLGREIGERDTGNATAVAVVNERFAKDNFPAENPVGRHFNLVGRQPHDIEIIGVSKDSHYGEWKEDVPPVIYVPYFSGLYPVTEMTYAVRTAGDPLAYVNSIRQIVHGVDSRVPVANIRTQKAQIDETISQEITFAKLCTALALLALVIACVGLYATMSYTVARRTIEIGIRLALGAPRAGMILMVLRQVVVLVAVGLAIGLPVALGTSRLVASFLFGMKANDPLALIFAVAMLLASALLAGYFPAWKASQISPMIALRRE